MRIETERLIITELDLSMANAVHTGSLDSDTRRFTPDEVFDSEAEAQEAIKFLTSRYQTAQGPFVYAVLLKDGTYVGYVQAISLENNGWEIGYHTVKCYTGMGYATESVTAFLPIIMKRLSINEINGICISDNLASVKVLEKCGFTKQYEGAGTFQGKKHNICKYVYSMQ
ncbi:MAG: GNAT family N-acetyltransferase [Clostridia bacterium]|nr:GNAT family N-acetyltransferase [Clostridia bacterium]